MCLFYLNLFMIRVTAGFIWAPVNGTATERAK